MFNAFAASTGHANMAVIEMDWALSTRPEIKMENCFFMILSLCWLGEFMISTYKGGGDFYIG